MPPPINNTGVIALMGQSNAMGRDPVTNLVNKGIPANRQKVWKLLHGDPTDPLQWTVGAEPINNASAPLYPILTETSHTSSASSYMDYLANKFPGRHFATVPCGLGGTAISPSATGTTWARNGSNPKDTTTLYGACLTRLLGVISQGYKIDAIVWYQGETDAVQLLQAEWSSNFSALIQNNLRTDLGSATLRGDAGDPGSVNIPFVVVALGSYSGLTGPQGAAWDELRTFQTNLNLSRTSVVSAGDLPMYDTQHISWDAQVKLGKERIGPALEGWFKEKW